jgi:hypothetical protein
MARADQRCRQHGMEILDPVLAALAGGAGRAVYLGGAVILRAVQRDQHMAAPRAAQMAEVVHPARSLQFAHDIGEHRLELRRRDRIEHHAYLAIAGDLAHAKQRLAVRAALASGQMPLMGLERRALHEEHRESGQPEIRHLILRILAPPPVRQRLAAATQRVDKPADDLHTHNESKIAPRRKPPVSRLARFVLDCCITDSLRPPRPPLPNRLPIAATHPSSQNENCCQTGR